MSPMEALLLLVNGKYTMKQEGDLISFQCEDDMHFAFKLNPAFDGPLNMEKIFRDYLIPCLLAVKHERAKEDAKTKGG